MSSKGLVSMDGRCRTPPGYLNWNHAVLLARHIQLAYHSVLHPFFYLTVNSLFSVKRKSPVSICWPARCCPEVHFIPSPGLTDVEEEMKAFEGATSSLNEPFKCGRTEIQPTQRGGSDKVWRLIHSKREMCKKMLWLSEEASLWLLQWGWKISFIGKTWKAVWCRVNLKWLWVSCSSDAVFTQCAGSWHGHTNSL